MKLQKSLKRLLGMAALVSLAACSSHKIVLPSDTYDVGAKPGHGTVVMSVEQKGLHRVPFSLLYREAGSNKLLSTSSISLPFGYRYKSNKTDTLDVVKNYSQEYGHLSEKNHENSFHVFKLPAGQYEFYGMYIEDDYKQGTWIPVKNFSIKFDVNASKATYVGNIGIETSTIDNDRYIVKSVLSRNNHISEDKQVLSKLFPSINLNKLVESAHLAEGTGLKVSSRHYGLQKDDGNGRGD